MTDTYNTHRQTHAIHRQTYTILTDRHTHRQTDTYNTHDTKVYTETIATP